MHSLMEENSGDDAPPSPLSKGPRSAALLSKQQGVSLIETLVVVALIGILALLSLPGLESIHQQSARQAGADHLIKALQHGRRLAIARHQAITVCPLDEGGTDCGRDWTRPLAVIKGDHQSGLSAAMMERKTSPPARLLIHYTRQSHRRRIKFDALGHSSGYNGRFHLCPAGADQGITVVLSQSGRLRVAETSPDCHR